MIYEITKGWFGRWNVYEVGHLDCDRTWVATFSTEYLAKTFGSNRTAQLLTTMQEACDLLAERTYGNPARSAGHNARLRLEAAIKESQ